MPTMLTPPLEMTPAESAIVASLLIRCGLRPEPLAILVAALKSGLDDDPAA